jgi:NADH:ubiquinone oxidoreductase subunit F (NADH-binding)
MKVMTAKARESSLPRLLTSVGELRMADLHNHLEAHGPLPALSRGRAPHLIELVHDAGLRGHGGAAFPTGAKLRAVAKRRGSKIIVANGTEGEPASRKDRVLMREAPHLVLDGAELAARAVGAGEAIVALSESDGRSLQSLTNALAERDGARVETDARFELFIAPERYLSGHEGALVNAINGGEAKPSVGPRPFERGVRRRPTLVQNVETLAHIALIARHGAEWFRALGTDGNPGSTLITLTGAVRAPGVYEIDRAMPLEALLQSAGVDDGLQAVLIGGYSGTWLTAEQVRSVRLSAEDLAPRGASLGAGVIVVLGPDACAVAETTRVADYMAAESAGQCGPCVNGLDAIADTVQQLATGTAERSAQRDLQRWAEELPRRGACQHPDGAVRFISSAMRVFEQEFADHARRGRCEQCSNAPVLPTSPARR